MQLVIHPEALSEVRAVAIWYDDKRDGLGDDFSEAITAALTRILATPHTWPQWPGTGVRNPMIRRLLVETFPYAVAFEVPADHVLVLAVPHARRRPLYWIHRATP